MALMTHQIQGSYTAFPFRPVSWGRRMEPKRFLLRSTFVKRNSCLCVGAPLVQQSKGKSLIIVSFKGKNGESGGRESGSDSAKNSADHSCVPHDSEEALPSSSKKENGQLFSMSEADKKLPGSVAIQKLFKSWLTLLHTPSPDLVVDGSSKEPPLLKESSETKNVTLTKERGGETLKSVWFQILGLDATIKLTILVEFLFCMAVTIKYGPKITLELVPFCIVGALPAAFLIQMFMLEIKLFAFTFAFACRQIVRWIIIPHIIPRMVAFYDFIVSGKLIEKLRLSLWQPILDLILVIMNWSNPTYVKGRAEAWKARKKAEWDEKVMDFKESIWPYYCRTIRTLKQAKLID